MTDPALDAAADILRASGRVAMTPTELTDALRRPGVCPGPGGDSRPAELARRLSRDRRFVVIETGIGLPGLDAWTGADRAAYASALGQLGLPPSHLVLLRAGALDPPGPVPVERLLQHTLEELLELPGAPRLVNAADETGAALARINRDG